MQRLAVLFSRLSGYMAASLKTLKERYGTEILVVRHPPAAEAPFAARHFDWIDHLYDRPTLDRRALNRVVTAFQPDAALMAGWFDRDYLALARMLRRAGVPVVAGSDAQWTGSMRQRMGSWTAPWYLHTAIDVLWVAGERQRQLAARLGFRGPRCWTGYYACDWAQFAATSTAQSDTAQSDTAQSDTAQSEEDPSPRFLFVGRYAAVKGLDVLVEGYRQYRARVDVPWSLMSAGAGEQVSLLQQAGIVDHGFVQPDHLPALMRSAAAFVLPSRREPWGVVLQEAAAAGCPLIASDACGAGVHLLQDGYNGFQFASEDPMHLAYCMERMSAMPEVARRRMGRRSCELSKQYTPDRWAGTLYEGVAALRSGRLT